MSQAMKISSFDYTSTSANNTLTAGMVAENEYGDRFMWVYNAGATTGAAGKFAGVFSTTPARGHVSMTTTTQVVNGVSTGGYSAGVFQASPATTVYSWIQISGIGVTAGVTDGGIAAGDPMVVDGAGSPDGVMETMADGEEENVAGYAFAADSSTTLAAGNYSIRSVWA